MDIIYSDKNIAVCIKPAGVLSSDDPGGMPELIGRALNIKEKIYVVHRLDKDVSGLMVFALNKKSAAALSRQVAEHALKKTYLAVIHGHMDDKTGRLDDLLFRVASKNKTYLVKRMRKGVRKAALAYEVLAENEDASLVKINLITGRTHQIRAQFSGRQHPLFGDKKYGVSGDSCGIALWSYALEFSHPVSGKPLSFKKDPSAAFPWDSFELHAID